MLTFILSTCRGSCNSINDPYAKLCVLDVLKNINVKVFNLLSKTNETRHIEWHEKCKELIHKRLGNKDFI